MRFELIDDIRDAWRFWSLRLMAVAIFLSAWPESFLYLYFFLPPDVQDLLPGRTAIMIVCMALAFAARVIKQKKPDASA